MLAVLKYGGHALASHASLRHLISQVQQQVHQAETPPLVVISAMAGMAENLHTLVRLVRAGHADSARALFAHLKQVHRTRARETVRDRTRLRRLLDALDASCGDLEQEMKQLEQLPYGSAAVPWQITRVTNWGERLAVLLVASALEDASIHAHALQEALVQTAQPSCEVPSDGLLSAFPLLEETRQHACRVLIPLLGQQCVPVIAGGLAQTRRGSCTSLGTQGADLAAALLTVAFNAHELIIFTRGAGILRADPALVADAVPLPTLSAEEAHALLAPGGTPVHPQVIPLLASAGIPLWVRPLCDPTVPGTKVSMGPAPSAITAALALHPAVALLTFTGRICPDSAAHLTRLLHLIGQIGVAPLMVTLTNPTHLSVLLEERAVEAAMEACAESLDTWEIHCQRGLAACHGIGAHFGGNPLLRAEAVKALLVEGIPILSEGCSEVGMMLVIKATAGKRAMRCLHQSLIPPVVPSNSRA